MLSPQNHALQDGFLDKRFGRNNSARSVSCGVARLTTNNYVPLGHDPKTLDHVELHGAVKLELPLLKDGLQWQPLVVVVAVVVRLGLGLMINENTVELL